MLYLTGKVVDKMDDKELLEALGRMMDEKLQPIKEDITVLKNDINVLKQNIDSIKEDINIIKEDSSITRSATNDLLDWAEKAQVQVQIPLFQKTK